METKNNATVVSGPSDTKKPYISPSQISMFTKCGEMYRRRYVKKEIIPPGIAMIKGSSVHKGNEENFRQKLHSRQDLKMDDIVDLSVAHFDSIISRDGILLDEEQESIGKDKIIGEAKDSTSRLAQVYAEKVAPKYQPAEIEMKKRIILPNSTHDLLSIADVVTEDEDIVELKTGKAWSQEKLDSDNQVVFQALTFHAEKGHAPRSVILESMTDSKIPKVTPLVTHPTPADYQALISRINIVLDAINKGVYPPAYEGGWWCSKNFCGYWSTCDYVKKKR